MPGTTEVRRIRIWGIVQGVGMRPLVARLARSLSLRGSVRNAGGMLEIIIAGPSVQLDLFWSRLLGEKPEPAVFVRHQTEILNPDLNFFDQTTAVDFVIETSREDEGLAFPAPDLAICAACEAELDDLADRRYRHPFISCMHCGPRYSILERLPYDREATTMSTYPMCPACEKEYKADTDRRFHAQTIACPDCGPVLEWVELTATASPVTLDALDRAIEAVRAGSVIAVKATGGYHLVCDARNQAAVLACRAIKQRDQKPFAVLFANPAEVRKHAELNPAELDLLESQARPVVLLRQRQQVDSTARSNEPLPLAAAVSMQSPWLGAMLPSTPIQMIIAEACGPLVMTSANRSDDQLIFRDDDMLRFGREQPGLAGILTHDRPILTGLDDSVVRWFKNPEPGRAQLIRRARGYVPLAIDIGMVGMVTDGCQVTGTADGMVPVTAGMVPVTEGAFGTPAETEMLQNTSETVKNTAGMVPVTTELVPVTALALGADLKSTSAWSTAGFVWPTQPAGDLARLDVQQAWQDQQRHLQRLLRIVPDLVCHDLHPAYFSTETADEMCLAMPNLRLLPIQHHHAHIASVIAEHHLKGPVLGVAMDGTGFGTDQTIWGGEFLICSECDFERMAHFKSVILPGGDTGMRDAWRSLAGYLEAAGLPNPTWLAEEAGSAEQISLVRSALRAGINCVANSSVGRLFDAVCTLLGLSSINHFEGECGSLLEYQAICARDQAWTPWPLTFGIDLSDQTDVVSPLIIDPAPVISGIFEAMAARKPGTDEDDLIPRLALGFHQAICDAVLEVCQHLSARSGLHAIALSGGVFQNSVLVMLLDLALTQAGFRVYWNEKVPPHDGGICLGQAWLGKHCFIERK